MGVSTVTIGMPADLRHDRHRRAAAARDLPLRPGARPRRRMGRRRAARHRECTARQGSLYGCFPQLGAPLGFLGATGVFTAHEQSHDRGAVSHLGLARAVLASAALRVGGPVLCACSSPKRRRFSAASRKGSACAGLSWLSCAEYRATLILGTLSAIMAFVVFCLMTVFALGWATGALANGRQQFLILQMIGVFLWAGNSDPRHSAPIESATVRDADDGRGPDHRVRTYLSSRCSRAAARSGIRVIPGGLGFAPGPDLRPARQGSR